MLLMWWINVVIPMTRLTVKKHTHAVKTYIFIVIIIIIGVLITKKLMSYLQQNIIGTFNFLPIKSSIYSQEQHNRSNFLRIILNWRNQIIVIQSNKYQNIVILMTTICYLKYHQNADSIIYSNRYCLQRTSLVDVTPERSHQA